ncbi:MAG TPA: cation diffusion facilitator family transporter [Acetobacteraceae bacterium]|jgi:cobalt-zinc-cadmium efflux system protein
MESSHHDRAPAPGHPAGRHPGQGHGHVHGHGHHGPGAATRRGRAFAFGAGINLAFVAVQVGFGLAANSMALLADAAHNFADVLALLAAWGAASLTSLPPTRRRTYGWGRSSILAALGNAMVLLIGVGAIGVEALRRLFEPAQVATLTVMLVAAIGIVVNGGSALLFLRDREHDLNVRAQFLHLAADVLISAGVVAAAAAISVIGWLWLDPLASLAIVAVVVASTWGVLRQSVDLAMDAVPAGVSQEAVQDWLAALPGVTEVHDLHIWALSTTETALTAHLVYAGETSDRRLHDLSDGLRRRFGIGHATLQIESSTDAALCRLRPNDVV